MTCNLCFVPAVVKAVVRSDIGIVFDEICAVVLPYKNSVKVLAFVGQTVVWFTVVSIQSRFETCRFDTN